MDNSKNNLFYFDNSYDQPVAGVDEDGRGPLDGHVVAAAVIGTSMNLNKPTAASVSLVSSPSG